MVSKNLIVVVKFVIPVKYMIFGGCVKVKESSYTQVNIWVNNILILIDARAIYLGMNVLA